MTLAILAAVTTALGLAPVALHRRLFRSHEKVELVTIADGLLKCVLVLFSLLTSGVLLFVLDGALSPLAGVIGGGGVLALLVVVLMVIPRRAYRRAPGRIPGR